MLRAWATSQKAKSSSSSPDLAAANEEDALRKAMAAAMRIMNDDLEGAEKGLADGDSAFHRLGKALVAFLRAALGFEKDVMREAHENLSAVEAFAASEQKRAAKEPAAFKSAIYDPGTEFALIHAQCLLMGAVISVLNESLTDALKGFYNLRKAYITLSGIIEVEEAYFRKNGHSQLSSRPVTAKVSSSVPSIKVVDIPPTGEESGDWEVVPKDGPKALGDEDDDNDDDEAFEDAAESREDIPTPMEYLGKTEVNGVVKDMASLTVQDSVVSARTVSASVTVGPATTPAALVQPPSSTSRVSPSSTEASVPSQVAKAPSSSEIAHNPDDDIFAHPIDEYIHSGVSLCFGILLLMLSLIPPAFGRLLSIVGFKGDRERGIRMLWRTSTVPNIHGAMAGLVVLDFYNGLINFCDVIPDANPNAPDDTIGNLEGYPQHRLEPLLTDLRQKFPSSGLWRLEVARMLASKREIEDSIRNLSVKLDSPLKQVNALAVFERALQAMYSHRYELCADSFIECTALSNWSHSLYYYIAGAARVELYRLAVISKDEDKAKLEAAKAEKYFSEVSAHAGKRKFMAKQMPLETFALRKLSKWEERAKARKVTMIEAIGVSPIEEMIYHWNGYKKMKKEMLQRSLEALEWSERNDAEWQQEPLDEKAILYVSRAAVWRTLGQMEEAKQLLQREVIAHDKSSFKGGNRDDWPCPCAHYEMAVNLWLSRTQRGQPDEGNATNRKLVSEAQDWIEKVRNWESYSLDARIGIRVSTASETLSKWRDVHDK